VSGREARSELSATGCISTLERERTLDALSRERFDLAIVGGGIAGAGLAREAAQRGLSVALLEAEDFAAGTSGRSTKLIHGGLRYLARAELGLVRESALERKRLHRLAPHLAEPRWLLLPARSLAGALAYRSAVCLYERLGAVESADRHRVWGRDQLARREPLIERSTWRFAVAYREYLTDDARLVLANLRDAVAAGARALNHARVEGLVREAGIARGLEVRCGLSGRSFAVRARGVIDAAGPWVDALAALEDPQARPFLHLTKGVHLSLPAERVPIHNLLYLKAADGRLVFAIRRGACVYVGTTDTTYPRAELWPRITRADVSYLLELLPRYLAVGALGEDDVTGAWAGLRALVAQPGKSPGEVSRREALRAGPARVVHVAGGKLTGYLPEARRALARAAALFGLPLRESPAERPLPGGNFDGDVAALEARLSQQIALDARTAARLARLYGSEAADVAKLGVDPLVPGTPVLEGEVEWAVRCEGAATLEDFLYRRSRAPLYDADVCRALAEPAARRMALLLDWSDLRRAAELESARARLAADRSWDG
jgi:glycerol-3-phosphate dehydrogenase